MGARAREFLFACVLLGSVVFVAGCGLIPGVGMKDQSADVLARLNGSTYAADWDFSLYETVPGEAEAGHKPPTVYRVLATSKQVDGYSEVMNIIVYADDSMGLEGRVDSNLAASFENPIGGSAETDKALMELFAKTYAGKAFVWATQTDGDPAETVKSEGKATYRLKTVDVSGGKPTGDVGEIMKAEPTKGEAVVFDYDAKTWSVP